MKTYTVNTWNSRTGRMEPEFVTHNGKEAVARARKMRDAGKEPHVYDEEGKRIYVAWEG